jgi:hypothetical protein
VILVGAGIYFVSIKKVASPTPIQFYDQTPTPNPKSTPTSGSNNSSGSKESIEKILFVDVFTNYSLDVDAFWKIGTSDFVLHDPTGIEINKDNYETLSKYQPIEWIQNPTSLHIRLHNPTSGQWKITAINPTVDFSDFKVQTSGTGENNLFFSLKTEKISYSCTDKPLISGFVYGPYIVKGINISGIVLNQKTNTEKVFNLYDDGSSLHGDKYAGDGFYSNYLSGYFDEPADYQITMVADNMNGKGMTVVPGDSPYIVYSFGFNSVKSKPVPKFIRTKTITISCF